MAITKHRGYSFFNHDNFLVHFVTVANFILKSSQLMQDNHNITFVPLRCMVVHVIGVHMIMLISIVTWMSFTDICRCLWNRSRPCQQISLSLRCHFDEFISSCLHSRYIQCLFWWWGACGITWKIFFFSRHQGPASWSTHTLHQGYHTSWSRTINPFTFVTN